MLKDGETRSLLQRRSRGTDARIWAMARVNGPFSEGCAQRYVFEEHEFASLGELTAHFSREHSRLRAEIRALHEGDQALMLQLLQQAYEKGFAEGRASSENWCGVTNDAEYVPTAESIL